MRDEWDRLRRRLDALPRPARAGPGGGSPAFVGRVFANTAVPTTTGVFFSVYPVSHLGPEVEGGTATATVDTTNTLVRAFVAGGKVPVAGDDLICRLIGSRWVADRIGGGSLCGCPAPASLSLAWSGVPAGPAPDSYIFHAATLTYGAVPSTLTTLPGGATTLRPGSSAYLSTASFVDANGDTFRYHLACSGSTFTIARIYENSVFGSPFEESARYTWTIGSGGATCTPFSLAGGHAYTGAAAGISGTIS